LRPVPGGDGAETFDADAAGGVHLPVASQPLTPLVGGLRAEDEREELDRLEASSEIGELRRELLGDATRDRGSLVGCAEEDQRAGELVRRLAFRGRLTCKLVRTGQMFERARQRHHHLDPPELEQELRAQLRSRRLFECAPQQRDRRVGVALGESRVRSRGQRLHHPVLAARRHDEQVRRHLFSRSIERHERRGCALVVQLALAGCEVVVNGRLHQRVHEAERRVGSQDLGVHELSGCGGDGDVVELGQLGHDRDARPVAEHGDCPRDLNGVCREPGKPQHHRSRGRSWAEISDQRDVGRVGRHSIGDERLEELVEQERVAVGRGMTRFGEGDLHLLAQPVTDELRDSRRGERPWYEHLGVRLAPQLLQDRLIGLGLRRAEARQEYHRKIVEPPGEIGEKPQRGAVAPVEIVHDEQQRALGA
jgi:hypothetical protein